MLLLVGAYRTSRAFGARVLLALMVLAASAPADARTTRNLRLGAPFEFLLEGNPSTGYKWVLNTSTSTGLDVVKVESLGYGTGDSKPGRVGARAPFKFRLTCLKAGFANLFFDYVGPTGQRSRESHETWVHCE